MADEDLKVRASLEDDLTGPLRDVEDQVDRTARSVRNLDRRASSGSGGLDKLARAGSGLARVAGRTVFSAGKVAALGIGLMGAAAVAGGAKLITLASDAGETASKFATVFRGNSAEVDRWVKATNAAYGITTKDLQDVTSRFGVFGKAAGVAPAELQGFSTSLAQAGLDLSSFYNVDPEEAFTALSSGLAGEAEPLRRFGIFLSDATMKAEAASMGLTGELTEAQKVMVRQRLILKSLGDADGDLARTKDSLANKTRALRGRFTELGTQIGTALLPVASRLVGWLDDRLSPIVTKLTEQAPNLAAAFTDLFDEGDAQGVAEVLDNIFGNTGRLIGPILTVADLARGLWGAFTGGGGAGEAVALIDNAVGAGGRLVDGFDKVREVVGDVLTIWRDALNPAIEELGPVVGGILSPLTLVDDVLGFLADNAAALKDPLKVVVLAFAAWKAGTMAVAAAQAILNLALSANPIGLIVIAVVALIAGLVLAYQRVGWFRAAVQAAGRFASSAFGWIVEKAKQIWVALEPVRELIARIARVYIAAVITYVKAWWTALQAVAGAVGWVIGKVVDLWNQTKPVRDLLLEVAGNGLATLKDAVGWVILKVVDLWNKTEPARELLADLGDIGLTVLKDAVGWVVDKLQWLIDNGSKVAGFVGDVVGAVGSVIPGDTPRPRAVASAHRSGRGGGYHARAGARANLARSMAVHRSIDGRVPGRRVVTSSLRSWALGSPGSDHGTGRAYDLKGSNLNTYAREVRAAGGFAEHHGSGAGRHLHVAVGDTPRPRARVSAGASSDAGTLIVVEPGAIVVNNPASSIDLEEAIAAGIARYDRDRRERGARR